jgi:SAM-dependent methyltransferase
VDTRDLAAKEQQELRFWRESETERPGAEDLSALVNKLAEARVAYEKLTAFGGLLRGAATILELGAGQGWFSCMLARSFPDARVLCSDISADALRSLPLWERVYGVRVARAFAARSYVLPIPGASVDAVVTFAAAHHFRAHRRTLREIARVLRPGGVALYLHEPSCVASLHALARWRVNRKRPVVPEDVLIYREIEFLARDAGLATELNFAPTTTDRGPTETLYYSLIKRSALLQRALPCTIDYVFRQA